MMKYLMIIVLQDNKALLVFVTYSIIAISAFHFKIFTKIFQIGYDMVVVFHSMAWGIMQIYLLLNNVNIQ